jgi:hypothetical protein
VARSSRPDRIAPLVPVEHLTRYGGDTQADRRHGATGGESVRGESVAPTVCVSVCVIVCVCWGVCGV